MRLYTPGVLLKLALWRDVQEYLLERLPDWKALDIVPSEPIGDVSNYDRGHRMYGMNTWIDLFAPRQLAREGGFIDFGRPYFEGDAEPFQQRSPVFGAGRKYQGF